jgi:CRP-like cAMP-binding protein
MQKTVLLIEDNGDLLDNTSELLELASYHVITAVNGREGIEAARKHKPDIILCDVMMPDLDGYGVIRALGNIPELKGTPFVFVTAKSEKHDFRYGMGLGADDYLTKPFNGEDLLTLIETRIKKAQSMKDSMRTEMRDVEKLLNEGASLEDISSITGKQIIKKLAKKEILFVEGETSHYVFYMISGKMKLFKTNDMGKEYISHIYTSGDLFGYTALLDGGMHEETAEALEESEVALITREDFFDMVRNNPELSLKFLKNLSSDNTNLKENLVKLAYNSARKRVAEALIYLAQKYAIEGENPVSFTASRNDISALSGIAPESVSRNLSDFKEEGLLVIQNGYLQIIDLNKLHGVKN